MSLVCGIVEGWIAEELHRPLLWPRRTYLAISSCQNDAENIINELLRLCIGNIGGALTIFRYRMYRVS